MVAHSQSTDPKRSCSVALRLCSLVCQRATVRVKGILVGEGSVHATGLQYCPQCMVSRYLPAEWNAQARACHELL